MKKRTILIAVIAILAGMFLFMQTYSVDLLPKSLKGDENAQEMEARGKAILKNAWKVHGVDSLNKHQVYQFTAVDDWKGMMAEMGKLWPQVNTTLNIKYAINTFDAQLEFLDGKTKGLVTGLQSWNYYEKPEGGKINFEVEDNERFVFGMAAFQYFSELVGRLNNAELIRYAGEKEFNNKSFHLVYVTWGSLEVNEEHDQYVLYVNKANNMLEYAVYTVRDNYLNMPGADMFHGSIEFSDYRSINGYQVPFTQTVFMNNPDENRDNYLHQLKLTSFSFDDFDISELYPSTEFKTVGDSKQ